ncbi:hypothetical protein ACX93W_08120 [Paenibacillus sp. CAU 1782]
MTYIIIMTVLLIIGFAFVPVAGKGLLRDDDHIQDHTMKQIKGEHT